MKKFYKEVIPVATLVECDNCGDGEYIGAKPVTCEKGNFLHVCNKCGSSAYLDNLYPIMGYIEKPDSEKVYLPS